MIESFRHKGLKELDVTTACVRAQLSSLGSPDFRVGNADTAETVQTQYLMGG
jgi:hypothetical protein